MEWPTTTELMVSARVGCSKMWAGWMAALTEVGAGSGLAARWPATMDGGHGWAAAVVESCAVTGDGSGVIDCVATGATGADAAAAAGEDDDFGTADGGAGAAGDGLVAAVADAVAEERDRHCGHRSPTPTMDLRAERRR